MEGRCKMADCLHREDAFVSRDPNTGREQTLHISIKRRARIVVGGKLQDIDPGTPALCRSSFWTQKQSVRIGPHQSTSSNLQSSLIGSCSSSTSMVIQGTYPGPLPMMFL